MRRAVFLLSTILLIALGGSIPRAGALEAENLPNKASLSANRMRFDSKTGDFLAAGNVVIKADGLTVSSPRGIGNTQRREVLFDEGVTASGDWQGDRIDLQAGSMELFFGEPPSCRIGKGVRGGVGEIALDADRLTLIGRGGLSGADEGDGAFGADSVEGVLREGVLVSMTAKSKVWIEGRPNRSGDAVSLRGDRAVYSEERGSVVLSGNVRAVQKGRTLTSDSLVYFPDQNRVEALGGMVSRSGTASADRATITIDLSKEPKRTPTPAASPDEAKKGKGGKKTAPVKKSRKR